MNNGCARKQCRQFLRTHQRDRRFGLLCLCGATMLQKVRGEVAQVCRVLYRAFAGFLPKERRFLKRSSGQSVPSASSLLGLAGKAQASLSLMRLRMSSLVIVMVSPRSIWAMPSRTWAPPSWLERMCCVSCSLSHSSYGIMTTLRPRELMMTGSESSTQVRIVSARFCLAAVYESIRGVMSEMYRITVLLSSKLQTNLKNHDKPQI